MKLPVSVFSETWEKDRILFQVPEFWIPVRQAGRLVSGFVHSESGFHSDWKIQQENGDVSEFQNLYNMSESSGSEENDSEEFVEENILSVEDRQKYFFAKIISHEEFEPPTVEDNENVLRQFFDEYNANLAAGFDIDKLPFTSWAILLKKLGIKVSESDLLPRLKNALIKFVNVAAWSKMKRKIYQNQLKV